MGSDGERQRLFRSAIDMYRDAEIAGPLPEPDPEFDRQPLNWILILRWLFFGVLWPVLIVVTPLYPSRGILQLTLLAFCIAPFAMIVAGKFRRGDGGN